MNTFYLGLSLLLTLSLRGYTQDTIELKKYFGNLKKVDITVEGQSYSFLFDTGGGETFISPEIAKRLHKTIYGNCTSYRIHGEMVTYPKIDSISINIGSTTLFHATAGVWDLMSILPKELPKLDGVLSLKSFQGSIITLDLSRNRVILETPASYQKLTKKMTLLQSRFANGLSGNELNIFLNIPRGNHSYWFLFDSGNLDELLLSDYTAYEWGLQPDTVRQRKELNTLNIQLGRKVAESKAVSERIIYDGALNYALLSQSIFVINFPERQVWIN